ncbi:hypothetical protein AVEN_29374-1 [Araneus ventricosus]|uniref:Uncharacterized protein n=1 Tax=Araneus ventricosus TaxID=182803 RepID=A0A4Y2V636_ARAVE|nr:hypothetical protein AVEN_29374-1 [Araneus ventricosus]
MNWTLPTYVVIYPITPPHAVTFPLRRAEMGCGGKDNWNPYRAYLLSDFRNSLPSKEANRLRPAFNVVMGGLKQDGRLNYMDHIITWILCGIYSLIPKTRPFYKAILTSNCCKFK